MTDIIPSSGNVFADLELWPEAKALEIVEECWRQRADRRRRTALIKAIADAIRTKDAPAKHPSGIICKFENNTISIRIEWGDSDTFIELSDEFMAGVRAHYTEDLVAALKIALLDLKLLENDIRLEIEAGGGETAAAKYDGLESIRIAKAALSKAEGKL